MFICLANIIHLRIRANFFDKNLLFYENIVFSENRTLLHVNGAWILNMIINQQNPLGLYSESSWILKNKSTQKWWCLPFLCFVWKYQRLIHNIHIKTSLFSLKNLTVYVVKTQRLIMISRFTFFMKIMSIRITSVQLWPILTVRNE